MNLTFPERETPHGNITDFTYLSEDCFHFSQKGYARGTVFIQKAEAANRMYIIFCFSLAANALWNNMLEPVNAKTPDWTDTFTKFLCPTEEHPYFYTRENSENFFDIRSDS